MGAAGGPIVGATRGPIVGATSGPVVGATSGPVGGACQSGATSQMKELFLKYLIYLRGGSSSSSSNNASTSKQVITMSYYGHSPRYGCGAIRNAQLWPMIYPRWGLRYYVPSASNTRKFARPGARVLSLLRRMGVEIVDVSEPHMGPMLWRFLVLGDASVERFIVRDMDDRFSTRDALCVDSWVRGGKVLHCVRDHPNHSQYPLFGGMFGARTGALKALCPRTQVRLDLTLVTYVRYVTYIRLV